MPDIVVSMAIERHKALPESRGSDFDQRMDGHCEGASGLAVTGRAVDARGDLPPAAKKAAPRRRFSNRCAALSVGQYLRKCVAEGAEEHHELQKKHELLKRRHIKEPLAVSVVHCGSHVFPPFIMMVRRDTHASWDTQEETSASHEGTFGVAHPTRGRHDCVPTAPEGSATKSLYRAVKVSRQRRRKLAPLVASPGMQSRADGQCYKATPLRRERYTRSVARSRPRLRPRQNDKQQHHDGRCCGTRRHRLGLIKPRDCEPRVT